VDAMKHVQEEKISGILRGMMRLAAEDLCQKYGQCHILEFFSPIQKHFRVYTPSVKRLIRPFHRRQMPLPEI
jgi:hypothetical protein